MKHPNRPRPVWQKKAISEGYALKKLYPWENADGKILFWRIRAKHPKTGDKWIRPMYFDGNCYVLGEPKMLGKKPLYRLPRINGSIADNIWVVEGEPKVAALCKLGIIATTSGAADSAHSVDWTPLTNREVIIWRDNDEAGLRYATEVTRILSELGCRVRWIDVEDLGLEIKGDCVDWFRLNSKATRENVESLPMKEIIAHAAIKSTPTEPNRLVVVDLFDFLNQPIPAREKILPWMPTQSLCMIHARRGIGKTHVAVGIAYAIASGTEFLGWKAEKARKVMYIDGEMPAVALQDRFAKIIKSEESEALYGMLKIVTPDFQPSGIPDLATKEGQEIFDSMLDGIEVIILDNLSCLVRGDGQENDARTWLPVQEWALFQRTQGRSLLFIHHSGKSGTQRGTSKREDLLDTVICLKHPSDYEFKDGAVFEVHFEKARHIHGDELKPFEARLSEESGKQLWSIKPVEDRTYERVVKLHNEGLSQTEIAEELSFNKSTVSRHLKLARAKGLVQENGDTQRYRKRRKYHDEETNDLTY